MQAGTLDRIGKYQILGQIGQGAVGVVYKALDPFIERVVAVKTVSADLDSEPEVRARFFREARSAGQLSHKNIVTIYDLGEEAGKAYMAMEFLDGEDLKTIIARRETITLEQKLGLMHELLEGLAHAHKRQVIHRDIKPGNIYITWTGQLKILDFGLARLSSSDITRAGSVMGTPNYMSPEQIRGEKVDHRSDIFSAGATFYEFLTYRKPFDSHSLPATFFKILQQDPDPVDAVDPGIPAEFSKVTLRAMAKSPDGRYQSAEEMLRDIERLQKLVQERARQSQDLKRAEEERAEDESGGRAVVLLQDGRRALETGDCAAARRALSGALAINANVDGASDLARDITDAEERSRARKQHEQRVAAQADQVLEGLRAGDDRAAAEQLAALLRLDPSYPAAHELRGAIKEARTAREARERERSERISSAVSQAAAACEAGNFEGAIVLAREVLSEDAFCGDAAELLRRAELGLRRQQIERQIRDVLDRAAGIAARGELQAAVAELERCGPTLDQEPAIQGRRHEYRNQLLLAKERESRAEAERRDRVAAALVRSRSAMDQADYESAIEHAQAALAEDQGNTHVAEVLGEARRRLAELRQRQELERSAQLLLEQAGMLSEREDLAGAVSLLAGADPQITALSSVREALQRYRNALEARHDAEKKGAAIRRHLDTGRAAFERGNPESCLLELEPVLAAEPNHAEAAELRARAKQVIEQREAEAKRRQACNEAVCSARQALTDERFEDARRAVEKAAELDAENREVTALKLEIERGYSEFQQRRKARECMASAAAALENGNCSAAEKALGEALTAWPDVPGGAKLRARILKRAKAERVRHVPAGRQHRYVQYAAVPVCLAVVLFTFIYLRNGSPSLPGPKNEGPMVIQAPQTPSHASSENKRSATRPAAIEIPRKDEDPGQPLDSPAQERASLNMRRARQLYNSGKYEEARKAIDEILALTPGDQEASRLRMQLERQQQKEADGAMARLQEGKARAENAKALALAPDAYNRAQTIEADATRLYNGRAYGEAATRMLDALQAYAAAEADATGAAKLADQERIRASQRADATASRQEFEQARNRASAAGAEKKAADPFREAAELARRAQAQWDRGDFVGARTAFQVAAAAMLRAADAASSDQREWDDLRTSHDIAALQAFAKKYAGGTLADQALRRAEQLDWETLNRKDAAALRAFVRRHPDGSYSAQAAADIAKLVQEDSAAADREGVRQALMRYAAAYDRMDVGELKETWPTIPAETLNVISASFRNARSMQMELRPVDQAVITGDTAVVACQRLISQLFDKKPLEAQDKITIRLRRRGTGWVIESIQ